jgi:hypothetical protein
MKELYHWTSLAHLRSILESGVLRTTESNVGSPGLVLKPAGEHYGPDVVWLLDVPVLHHNHGLTMSPDSQIQMRHDKTEVRITVRVTDATAWTRWAPAKEMHPEWRRAFLKGAGGRDAARHWWVVEREIPRDEWLEIRTPSGVLDFTTR